MVDGVKVGEETLDKCKSIVCKIDGVAINVEVLDNFSIKDEVRWYFDFAPVEEVLKIEEIIHSKFGLGLKGALNQMISKHPSNVFLITTPTADGEVTKEYYLAKAHDRYYVAQYKDGEPSRIRATYIWKELADSLIYRGFNI